MKQLVVVGDTHLHPHKAFAQGAGSQNTRFQKTLQNLQISLDEARRLNCPWVQVGDWVHTIGFAQNPVLNHLITLLNKYPDVEKYTIYGNHDARSAGDQIQDDETVTAILGSAVDNLTVLSASLGVVETKNGLRIYGEGFQADLNHLVFSKWDKDLPLVDVGLFHQTVAGSEMPSGIRMDGGLPSQWLFDHFRLAVCGDVHEPQYWGKDGYNKKGPICQRILVPGSLEQHNFGDKSDRGWWEVTVGDVISWQFIPSVSPRFLTVETAAEVKQDGNFYRITTPTDPRDIPAGAVALSAPPTVVEIRTTIAPGASAREVLSAWMQLSAPPESIDRSLALSAGDRLLSAEGSVALRPTRLHRANLSNFLCYTSATFDIRDGITLVLGSGRDYSSNGAGKTTLFEAIFWALFGRTTKGVDANDVIQRGQNECSVELLFNDLLVIRTRKRDGTSEFKVWTILPADIHGNAQKLTERWGGTPKEVTTQLQKHLGLTPELYQALTYFSQSKLVLFSQASDAERKTMLSDLCGLDIYQKAATAARSIASAAEQEISQSSAAIGMLEKAVQEAYQATERLTAKALEWDQTAEKVRSENEKIIEETGRSIFNVEQHLHEYSVTLESRLITETETILEKKPSIVEKITSQLSGSLDEAKQAFEKWTSELTTLPDLSVLSKRKSDLEEVLKSDGRCLLILRKDLAEKSWEAEKAKNEIERLQKVSANCPTCGKPIDTTDRDRMLRELSEKRASLLDPLLQLDRQIKELEPLIQMHQSQITQLDVLINESKQRTTTHQEHETRIAGLTKRLAEQVEWLTSRELESLQKQLEVEIGNLKRIKEHDCQVRLETLNSVLRAAKVEVARYQINPFTDEQEKSRELEKEKRDRLGQEQDRKKGLIEQEKIHAYWAHGFSRAGIQSLLMEEVAGSFNQIRSQIFPILTQGIYDVQFATTSQTSAGDAREKTDFIIRDRGVLVTYESLSGGQRRRIDLGVMLSLAMAVSKTRNVPGVLGMMILDEVFGFLDQDGVEALYEALVEINQVVPSIYAVTHNPALISLFQHTMTVEQDSYGVSRIKEESNDHKAGEGLPSQRTLPDGRSSAHHPSGYLAPVLS